MPESRRKKILTAIIKHFIQTAEPVGSNTILVSYKFDVSPATIRKEMATLEHEGLLYQPHTSAGRIPTDLAYRQYVDTLYEYDDAKLRAQETLKGVIEGMKMKKIREKIYDAVSILSQSSQNVGFATLPDNKRTFYLGIANVLKQPEFTNNPVQASQVIEVLERNNNFVMTLQELEIDTKVKIYIGEENILDNIKSCSLIVRKYTLAEYEGYIGILGPTRIDYAFCTAILENIQEILI